MRYALVNAARKVEEVVDDPKRLGFTTLLVVGVPDGLPCEIGWSWNGRKFLDPNAVPTEVSAAQARLLLLQKGLLDTVETMIATQPREVQIAWEFEPVFHRDSSLLQQLAQNLNLSQRDIDQFFIEAAKL